MRGRVKTSLIGRIISLTFRINFNTPIFLHLLPSFILNLFPHSKPYMTNYPSHFLTYSAVNNPLYCEWIQSLQERNPITVIFLFHLFENQKVTDLNFQF